MNLHHPPAPGPRWPGLLTHLAVIVVVLALAGATFVLSYAGVHAIAVAAGVPKTLARLYPAIFDAVLVVACTAALTLRDATLWARCYAWLSIVVLVAVIGTADAIHAMGVALPHRQTAGTVAALPWALVMLGFSLWLTMLRHARTQPRASAQQAASGTAQQADPGAAPSMALAPAVVALAPATAPAPPTSPSPSPTPEDAPAEAARTEARGKEPGTEEAAAEAPFTWTAHAEPFTGILPLTDSEPRKTPEPGADAEPTTHLRRVRSTPTPPEGYRRQDGGSKGPEFGAF